MSLCPITQCNAAHYVQQMHNSMKQGSANLASFLESGHVDIRRRGNIYTRAYSGENGRIERVDVGYYEGGTLDACFFVSTAPKKDGYIFFGGRNESEMHRLFQACLVTILPDAFNRQGPQAPSV